MLSDFTQTMLFCSAEYVAHDVCHVGADPGIGAGAGDVQEERAVVLQHALQKHGDGAHPGEILGPVAAVVIGLVAQADVVGRRGHDDVDRAFGKLREEAQAIADQDGLAADDDRTLGGLGGIAGIPGLRPSMSISMGRPSTHRILQRKPEAAITPLQGATA